MKTNILEEFTINLIQSQESIDSEIANYINNHLMELLECGLDKTEHPHPLYEERSSFIKVLLWL